MTWDDVTLGQFIQLQDAAVIEDKIHREIQMLMILKKYTVEQIERLTIEDIIEQNRAFNFLILDCTPDEQMPNFKFNGHTFKVLPLVAKMKTQAYMDFKELMKPLTDDDGKVIESKVVENMHRLCACFLVCDTLAYDNEVFSEAALEMPCRTALGIAAFFLSTLKNFVSLFSQVVPE